MKRSLLPAILIVLIHSIGNPLSAQTATEDLKKLDWLEGSWVRINSKPGRSSQETWRKTSPSSWEGIAINMKGTDTTLVEKLKLVIKENNIYYVADIPHNKEPVYFRFTSISDNGFICENPHHDFPKKITYQKEGNKIKATISGGGNSIDYLFEKK